MSSFEIISSIIMQNINLICIESDISTLEKAKDIFSFVYSELISIQNQLSKSFNYIHEIPVVMPLPPESSPKSHV